jgi:hypothetical protein
MMRTGVHLRTICEAIAPVREFHALGWEAARLMNDGFRASLRPGLVLAALLWPACAATAVPFVPDFSDGPVVFDFEDGLQGWVASGSVEHVATDALGGQWALFGDGLVGAEVDLSVIRIHPPRSRASAGAPVCSHYRIGRFRPC